MVAENRDHVFVKLYIYLYLFVIWVQSPMRSRGGQVRRDQRKPLSVQLITRLLLFFPCRYPQDVIEYRLKNSIYD